MRFAVLYLGGVIAATVAIMSVIFYLCDAQQRSECAKIGRITGHETHYPDHLNFDEGCFVKTDKGWVPLARWRVEGP